jgi:hypothetical protein
MVVLPLAVNAAVVPLAISDAFGLTVSAPLTVEAPTLTSNETAVLITKFLVQDRLRMGLGVAATVTVTVLDVLSITASSLVPGSMPPCQFPPEPHRPSPAPPVQRILAGTVRSSSDSKESRQRPRRFDARTRRDVARFRVTMLRNGKNMLDSFALKMEISCSCAPPTGTRHGGLAMDRMKKFE